MLNRYAVSGAAVLSFSRSAGRSPTLAQVGKLPLRLSSSGQGSLVVAKNSLGSWSVEPAGRAPRFGVEQCHLGWSRSGIEQRVARRVVCQGVEIQTDAEPGLCGHREHAALVELEAAVGNVVDVRRAWFVLHQVGSWE